MKNKKSKSGKIIALLIVLVLIGTVGVTVYLNSNAKAAQAETAYKETAVKKGNVTVGVTESGSITIGTITQTFEYDVTSSSAASFVGGMSMGGSSSSDDTVLVVDEIYVAVGEKLNEGDAILKFTEDSVEEYRAALEESVQSAQDSLEDAQYNAQKQQLSASYTYNLAVANGSVAESVYNYTINQLLSNIADIEEQIADTEDMIYVYEYLIAAGQDYSKELENSQKQLEQLEEKLVEANNSYATKSVEAERTYNETLLDYENAQSQYDISVNGIDNDVEDAEEVLSEAVAALAEFDELIGDGVIYAENAGVINSIGCEEGAELSSGATIITLADETAVTMTVSVAQEDVAGIAIGDVVDIAMTAYADKVFAGVVSSIDTSASSGSSTISYNVTVTFTDDISGIFNDMTGEVTFIEKQVTDVIYVSNKAVINEGLTSYVKVLNEDGTITKVEVVTGFSDGVNVEIKSGLAEGDVAIIESRVTK